MKEPIRNIAASILARLRNQTEILERPFAEILQYYAMERFLYRLSKTKYADKFVLKGGLLFYAWNLSLRRPTRDIDFRGYVSSKGKDLLKIINEVVAESAPEDGLVFDPQSISVQKAIEATFKKRDTEIPRERPLSLSAEFARTSQSRWETFLGKMKMDNEQVIDLQTVIEKIWKFLGHPVQASINRTHSHLNWIPRKGWK